LRTSYILSNACGNVNRPCVIYLAHSPLAEQVRATYEGEPSCLVSFVLPSFFSLFCFFFWNLNKF
jgi:hypothetical protein